MIKKFYTEIGNYTANVTETGIDDVQSFINDNSWTDTLPEATDEEIELLEELID